MANNLYTRISKSFLDFADNVLIEEGDKAWTYRDVEKVTAQLAAQLQKLGVKPGDRLLAQTEKSSDIIPFE